MALALRLGANGLGTTWPNPSVGAVLVQPGEPARVVGRGWTQPGGRPHAEIEAIRRAGDQTRGATLYVTLEPCAHHGGSPPCTDAIIAAGISRVVIGAGDPDPRVDGSGADQLKANGIEVDWSGLERDARWLHLGHSLRVQERRPFVQLKTAVGSDGLIAPGDGKPVWVTGPDARAQAHLMRARVDAILVGRGTVDTDNPALTCRLPGLETRSPVRVVLDSQLGMSPTADLVRTAPEVPLWILCRHDAPAGRRRQFEAEGAEIATVESNSGSRIDLFEMLRILAARGITRLLVEGGPTVSGALLSTKLVDEAVIFHGPESVGPGGLEPFGDKKLDALPLAGLEGPVWTRPIGADSMSIYRRAI